MWLPSNLQDRVRSLLANAPEVGALATELDRQLGAGTNGLTDPDAGTLAAIDAAQASLLADAGIAALSSYALSEVARGATLTPAAVDASNIIIEPTTSQSGAEVVQNPSGPGVVAQNSYRRPAALLAYETSWEDLDHVETEVSPPKLIGQVDVPATGQLELLNALWDAVSGDAPWAPEVSGPLHLAGHEGASRTHYQLVLVGPSVAGGNSAIMTDPRFTGMHDDWDDIFIDKSIDLFLEQLVVPLIEVYGMGSMARLDAAKLAKMRERVHAIYDSHLLDLGVYLSKGRNGYAQGLKFVLEELVENNTYRLDMTTMIREALQESDANKATVDAMEQRLSSRANATAILAAVQAVLVGGDVAKIMYDLGASWPEVGWTAVSAPALFALSPGSAAVSRGESSAKFMVVPKGNTEGNYRYRWTTSGTHGDLSDLLQPDAKTLDTDQKEVWYFHASPATIQDSDHDDVSVEVFEVPEGATSIPAGAKPIARMAAEVHGDGRVIDSRIEVNYGLTAPELDRDGEQYVCAEMLIRFKAIPHTYFYRILMQDIGGMGDRRNPNHIIREYGPPIQAVFDGHRGDLSVTEYDGPCVWRNGMDPDTSTWPLIEADGMSAGAGYDDSNDTFVYCLFTVVDYGHLKDSLENYVALWRDWVAGATFTVTADPD